MNRISRLRHGIVSAALVSANFLALTSAQAEDGAIPKGLDTGSIVQVSLSLIGILALILGLGWFMRRLGVATGAASGQLRVIGGISVGNRERVVLIQVGEEQLLLGVSTGQVRTLHVLDKPLEMAGSRPRSGSGAGEPQGFSNRLQQLMSQGTKHRGDASS